MSETQVPGWIYLILIPVLNILLAAVAAGLLFWYIDVNPFQAVSAMAYGAFGDSYGWGYTLYYTTSLIFVGLAVAVAFHCGLFNIGGDGQAYIGALGVGLVCLTLGGKIPLLLLLPLSIFFGGLFGAAWAFIPAWLQAYRGSHIVITTIMFNFIASALMGYLLVGALKPAGQLSAETAVFDPASWIPKVYEVLALVGFDIRRTPLNLSIIWALLCALAVYLFIWRTRWGYEIRTVGQNPSAAKCAGISLQKTTLLAMLASGMLAGFFALNVVQGEAHQVRFGLVNGMGYTGIAVALMGRNHPLGIVLASLLFGFLYQGGSELQFEYGIDPRLIVILQGLVILFSGAFEHLLKQPVERLYRVLAVRLNRGAV